MGGPSWGAGGCGGGDEWSGYGFDESFGGGCGGFGKGTGGKGFGGGGCGGFGKGFGGGFGGPAMGMGKGGGCWGMGGKGMMGGMGGMGGMMGMGMGMGGMGGMGMKGWGGPQSFGGFGGGCGGGNEWDGYQKQQKGTEIGPVQVAWVTLKQASQITAEGFPQECPALVYDKAAMLFSSAHGILQDLVNDVGSEVQFVHDPDWEQFPEVAAACQEAGVGDNCLGIATCPHEGKWAIGLGNGKAGRERACKAALALAIVAGTDRMEKLANQYPEFMSLCADAGLVPGGAAPAMGMQQSSGANWAPKKKAPAAVPAAAGGIGEVVAPAVTWLTVEAASKLTEAGFPADGPAVGFDKAFNEAFKAANQVLGELVGGDVAEMVQMTHDADWVEFPEVGKAIKEAGAEENCYCIATCPSAGKWACGIGSGWKNRENACKLALCLALTDNEETFAKVCMQNPAFGSFCASAGLAPGGGEQGPTKKRKVDGELQ